MPGVRPLPQPTAVAVSSLISIIVSGTWNPRVFADIFNIPRHILLTVFGMDDLARYNALVIFGHHVLHLVLSTVIYEKLHDESVMMATIMKYALSDSVVLEAIMVQQGVYAGPIGKGDTSVGDTFKVYIALYTSTFGFARCVDVVRDMCKELMCYAEGAIGDWTIANNVVLSNDFHLDYNQNREEVSTAAVSALLSVPPPSDCPDMLIDVGNTPEVAYNRLFSLGLDAIYAAVIQAIISLWPGSSSAIIQQAADALLSQPVLEVIPHYFQAEADSDCRLVYMWCARRAQHLEWQSICDFARSFVEPMLPAVGRTLLPLFLPNSSIPRLNLSGKAKLACQHMLLYIAEACVFHRYQHPTRSRLFQLLDSASNPMLWDTTGSAHYDLSHATQQLENACERLDQPAVSSQLSSDMRCISVKGFMVPQALETGGEQAQAMAMCVQNFIKHSQLATLEADLHCLGATYLQLDGSAILIAHKDSLRHLFGVRSAGSINLFHDEHEFEVLDRPFDDEDETNKQFLQAVARRVEHVAIKERNLLAYLPYLSSPPDSQLRDPAEIIPLHIFGKTVGIRCAPKTHDGYIPDDQYPDVSRFGVEFIGTDYLGVNVSGAVTENMKASLEGAETRLMGDKKHLQILYGAEVSDEFIANLNATVPRIHSVRGVWRRMDAAVLQNWAATVMIKKARLYRFTKPASSISQALSIFLP